MEIGNKTVTITQFILMIIVIVVGILYIFGIYAILSGDDPAYNLGKESLGLIFGLLFAYLIHSDAKKRKYEHVWLGVLLGLEFSLIGYLVWMMIRPDILQKA